MTTLSVLVLLFAAGLTWAVLYYGEWVLLRRRFVVISPGRVYQSAAMTPAKLIRCARRHGIRTIIDFRGAHEELQQQEAQALIGTGIRHINIPVGALPALPDLHRFHEVMTEELAEGRAVLLHCKDGQGRAVAFAAIYRIQFEGWAPRDAYLAAIRLPPGLRFATLICPAAGRLSARNRKTQLILAYQRIAALRPRTRAEVAA